MGSLPRLRLCDPTSYPVLRLKARDPPEMLCVVRHEYDSQRQRVGSHEGVESPDGRATLSL